MPPLGQRSYGNTIKDLVGVGIARTNIGKLERRATAGGGEGVMIMSERNLAGIKRRRTGVLWRSNQRVQQCRRPEYLDMQLQSCARIWNTKDTGIKIQRVGLAGRGGKG